MVRRHGPGPRGADGLRPAAVPRHGPRPRGRPGHAGADAATTCSSSATARAASSAIRAPSTRFGRAPQNITNAYIVWALTESGKDDDVTKELNALHEQAKTSKDPYFLALVANSLINRAKTADATKSAEEGGRAAEGRRPSRRRADEHHRLGRPRSADRNDGPGACSAG